MNATRFTGFVFGDCGKGTSTHYETHRRNATLNVRFGGPQAFHHGVTSDGREHVFRQFGSGSLCGARTHLSRHMIIEPYAILNEGRALQTLGEEDIFDRMSIHEDALVVTPYHAIANRLREYHRGDRRHGTIGLGVGETALDSERYPDEAIYAKDFGKPWLSEKLEATRARKLRALGSVIVDHGDLPENLKIDIAKLLNPELIEWATTEFNHLSHRVDIVDDAFVADLLRGEGHVVFEPSQGVLLDQRYGFFPHISKSRPTPDAADEILGRAGFDGEVTRLGIVRAYFTRHGAGPFVTEDPEMTAALPDVINGDNPWQGSFRIGPFDAVAIRYAIACCGGPSAFDGLVVTCLDRVANLPSFRLCDRYRYSGPESRDHLEQYFEFDGNEIINIRSRLDVVGWPRTLQQERIGKLLRACQPVYKECSSANRNAILAMITDRTCLPIKIVSFGPTERDKEEY